MKTTNEVIIEKSIERILNYIDTQVNLDCLDYGIAVEVLKDILQKLIEANTDENN